MYVVIEGVDTAGKSTQLDILKQNHPFAIFTKEPGGTPIGLELRRMVLNGEAKSKIAEMFLFLADRAEHIEEVVKPNHNGMVISDRSMISGIAYASELPLEIVTTLNLIATSNTMPSHVILLELSKEELISRLSQKEHDNIESRGIDYLLDIQERMKKTIEFLKINHIFIDASLSIEEIATRIEDYMSNIQSLRGMKDILNEESELFTYFIENASKIAKRYGYSYLETPILEETALFKRSVGESSDIVNKEMYQFIDKGENDVCLRPEGTAGVVRSFVQNKLDRAGGVYRYYYYGSMFRYERPQKGRLRQFHQFGCESFGVDSIYEDANIILLIKEILDFCGIKFKLQLNSLGCSECMPTYKTGLVQHLSNIRTELCEDCDRRITTNPIRVLDCKNEKCKILLVDAPKITHHLCSTCDTNFEKLKEILIFNDVAFDIDTNLVRGLDYYTQTAFEFVSDEIGAQSAIAGGGRYDRLVEFLGGRTTPAVGFAIGIERIWDLIKINTLPQEHYYFGALNDTCIDAMFKAATLKRKNALCTIEYAPRGFNKHFKNAEKVNATIMAIIGEEELKNETIVLRNLLTKEEKTILIKEL